jgi:hypothetical protein
MAVGTSLIQRYLFSSGDVCLTKVYERSIRVANEVFLEFGGSMLEPKLLYLMQEQARLMSDLFECGAKHIYLKCSPGKLVERFRRRGRESERLFRWSLNCD